jgi:hypothetical protein
MHTVLLKSEGTIVACGFNDDRQGQCDIPEPVAGQIYTHVAAGLHHTVLLTSEGTAMACGHNEDGQCDIPELVAGQAYVSQLMQALLLQASLDGDSICFVSLGGIERCRVRARHTSCLAGVCDRLMGHRRTGRLGVRVARVDAVLPDGRLLSSLSAEETVASAFGLTPPA